MIAKLERQNSWVLPAFIKGGGKEPCKSMTKWERKKPEREFLLLLHLAPIRFFPLLCCGCCSEFGRKKKRENWRCSGICQKKAKRSNQNNNPSQSCRCLLLAPSKEFCHLIGESLPFPTPCALCVVVVCHERENVGE